MQNIESVQSRRLLVLILGTLTCLGPLAIDLYLPAMPEIARSMGEPLGRIQLTLSAYTIGFALGQVVFGPLSDRFGRMKIILPGLVAYVITNILSSMAGSATELIIIRSIQALAGAAVMVCIPAMVRDLFPREECAKVLSSVLLVMAVATGGVDALAFTGGIGENSDLIRGKVLKALSFLGFDLDDQKNLDCRFGNEGVITTDSSKATAIVVATNEELMIAKDTAALI